MAPKTHYTQQPPHLHHPCVEPTQYSNQGNNMNSIIITIIAVGIAIAMVDLIALRHWAKSLWPLSKEIDQLRRDIKDIKEQLKQQK
tara:strand:+ start:84 stop:341 length:258 start_codon:yes stop_codon:yes gene_type:complete